MAGFDWGSFLQYAGQGVQQGGAAVAAGLTEADRVRRQKILDDLAKRKTEQDITQGDIATAEAQREQALTQAAAGPVAEFGQYAATKRTSDVNMLPTLQERTQRAGELGLTSKFAAVPEAKAITTGLAREQEAAAGLEEEQRKFQQQKDLQAQQDTAALERTKIMAKSQEQRTAATIKAKQTSPKPLNPTLQKAKDTRLEKFVNIVEENKLKMPRISEAEIAVDKIPSGIVGKNLTKYYAAFDPNNPVLAEWQKLKRILTDAQLMNTAWTKGAISDKEMALFARAAANDEMISPQKVKIILKALREDAETNESSAAIAYSKLYKEDPYEITGEAAATPRMAPAAGPAVGTAEDQQALEWANSNPNDPRAMEIKTRLGR